MRRIGMAGVVLAAAFLTMAGSASAEPATHCVKATKVGKKHTGGWTNASCTAVSPTHEGKYDKLASFTESEEAQLKAILKYEKVQASGVGGKPTVQFSGANVQIVNGEGKQTQPTVLATSWSATTRPRRHRLAHTT
jgi:hypothetical protein